MERTQKAIMFRAHRLKIYRNTMWSAEENEIMKQYYSTEGGNCYKRLNNKTKMQTLQHAATLHLSCHTIGTSADRWTEEDDNIIKQYYPIEGKECYKRIAGTTRATVKGRASFLGIKYYIPWTEEEIVLLKQGIKLPNRSFHQCLSKCRELNIYHEIYRPMGRCWSEEEDNILKKYYPVMGAKVSQMLGRSPDACTSRANKLKIKADRHKPNIKSCKRVLCLETGEIFESYASASRKYHCGNLSSVINGRRKTAGKLADGTKLHWKYVEES